MSFLYIGFATLLSLNVRLNVKHEGFRFIRFTYGLSRENLF